ncbi:MAG: hypothetical protein H0U85_01875 [Gemmatimonadales bacterium]|nr:hypothetical protein [Gemmatimonadales bacterium]
MKALRSFILISALAVSASAASAQTQVTLTSAGSVTAFGYYVGKYQGQLPTQPGAPAIDLFCVDFLHHVTVGQTWTANFTSLTGGDLSNTRLNSLVFYQKAAWLTAQYGSAPTSQWGDIQATIWQITNPGAGPAPSSSYWLDLVNAQYTSFDYSRYVIVTDVNRLDANSAQEFITTTPEPAELLLMGTGLLTIVLAGGFAQRRIV